MLLQACQRQDKGAVAADSAGTGAVADLGPMDKELHLYNWSDYIAEDTVPNFEKEFGVKVTYDTYESNEEMVAKLQAGASGYDLVCRLLLEKKKSLPHHPGDIIRCCPPKRSGDHRA